MRKAFLIAVAVAAVSFNSLPASSGQAAQGSRPATEGVGDTPDNPPALADLSGAFKRKPIELAMRKVGDWELKRAGPYFSQDWTFAALYAGFMAASKTLPEPRYEEAMMQVGSKFDWKLGPRLSHADDQAIGQIYLELYQEHHDPKMIAPIREQFNALMKTADDPQKPVWWWCDALFMAPPVWARLYRATGNRQYIDYMDRE